MNLFNNSYKSWSVNKDLAKEKIVELKAYLDIVAKLNDEANIT